MTSQQSFTVLLALGQSGIFSKNDQKPNSIVKGHQTKIQSSSPRAAPPSPSDIGHMISHSGTVSSSLKWGSVNEWSLFVIHVTLQHWHSAVLWSEFGVCPERRQPPWTSPVCVKYKDALQEGREAPQQSVNSLNGLVSYHWQGACVYNRPSFILVSLNHLFAKTNCLPHADHYTVASAGKIKFCCNVKQLHNLQLQSEVLESTEQIQCGTVWTRPGKMGINLGNFLTHCQNIKNQFTLWTY